MNKRSESHPEYNPINENTQHFGQEPYTERTFRGVERLYALSYKWCYRAMYDEWGPEEDMDLLFHEDCNQDVKLYKRALWKLTFLMPYEKIKAMLKYWYCGRRGHDFHMTGVANGDTGYDQATCNRCGATHTHTYY